MDFDSPMLCRTPGNKTRVTDAGDISADGLAERLHAAADITHRKSAKQTLVKTESIEIFLSIHNLFQAFESELNGIRFVGHSHIAI